MTMYEIYLSSDNTELIVEDCKTHESKSLKSMGTSFLVKADAAINEQYPATWNLLAKQHGESKEFVFGRVRHFFACNFSIKDGRPDIDEDWNFDLEIVPCPARMAGICKCEIGTPQLSSVFTDREIEVLRLFTKGFDEQEIADAMYVSKHTIHNHINNMYQKIDVRGKTSPDRKLVAYAYAKKIV